MLKRLLRTKWIEFVFAWDEILIKLPATRILLRFSDSLVRPLARKLLAALQMLQAFNELWFMQNLRLAYRNALTKDSQSIATFLNWNASPFPKLTASVLNSVCYQSFQVHKAKNKNAEEKKRSNLLLFKLNYSFAMPKSMRRANVFWTFMRKALISRPWTVVEAT